MQTLNYNRSEADKAFFAAHEILEMLKDISYINFQPFTLTDEPVKTQVIEAVKGMKCNPLGKPFLDAVETHGYDRALIALLHFVVKRVEHRLKHSSDEYYETELVINLELLVRHMTCVETLSLEIEHEFFKAMDIPCELKEVKDTNSLLSL